MNLIEIITRLLTFVNKIFENVPWDNLYLFIIMFMAKTKETKF